MRHFILLSFLFISLSSHVNSQEVFVNYAKSKSISMFDLSANADLYNVYGIQLKNKQHSFGLNYASLSFNYDEEINNGNQLLLNFLTDVGTFGFNYDYELGFFQDVKFDLGFTFAYSEFESSVNLKNIQGLDYEESNFSEWQSMGYYSDTDYETAFSEINPDNYSPFQKQFFSFGPTFTCSYEIVKKINVYIKSTYRTNSSDLLDNISINNLRDVSADSDNDNQIDFYFGLTFNLSANKEMDNDSLLNYIESITNDDLETTDQTTNRPNNIVTTDSTIISREEYILNYFETNTNSSVDNSTSEKYEATDQSDLSPLNDDNLNADSISREEFILSYFDIPNEESNSVISQIEEEDDILQQEEDKEDIPNTYNNTDDEFIDVESQMCYLIVGVFSEQSNLESMATNLQIDSDNYFIKNNLYYLYIFKSDLVSEARQLRDSLEVESWIYYSN